MPATKILRPEPLTRQAFLPFGQVLETDGLTPEPINFGNTQKFGNLADVSMDDGSRGQVSIYRSSAIELPFRIRLMERHPLGSQAFYPLHKRPFPVIVAATDVAPGFADIRVFVTNGHQGVNINPGIWHHYQLTLGKESEYVVFDRLGNGENYEESCLDEEVFLDL
jgi:ureidoglycolate lyase